MAFSQFKKGGKYPGATFFNAVVEQLNHSDQTAGRRAGQVPHHVWIENATGGDVSAFSVLSIDGFSVNQDESWGQEGGGESGPAPQPQGDLAPGINEILNNGLLFKGIKPIDGKPVAILLEDIDAGNVGKAVVSGPVPVWIDMKSKSHKFAEIVEDESDHLQSCESGTIQILGVKKEPAEGIQAASVNLGAGGSQSYLEGVIESKDGGV